jgi:hypothetical protein
LIDYEIIRFSLFVASVIWAITGPVSKSVYDYLFMQLVAAVFLEIPLLLRGASSKFYAVEFCFFTAGILGALLKIVFEYLAEHSARWPITLFALLGSTACAFRMLQGFEYRLNFSHCIFLVETSILVFAGMCLAFTRLRFQAPDRIVLNVLCCLCFAHVVIKAGVALHPSVEEWRKLNWYGNTWACVAAFVWLGIRLRCF